MISFVRGSLNLVLQDRVEIDTGSFGLEIFVPSSVLGSLPPAGSDITLYTYMNVREDEMSLYGFPSRDALQMFRELISVNGIGPKGALQILSAFTPDALRLAILAGDAKTISKAPGVGIKTAQRLCMELKDKVDFLSADTDSFTASETFSPDTEGVKGEAVSALTVLGYTRSEAVKAVSGIDAQGKTTEDILKEALKIIAL